LSWLPGAITKQHIHQWLTALGNKTDHVRRNWLIADLSKLQARTLLAVLEKGMVWRPAFPDLDVFVITSDWFLAWLKSKRVHDTNGTTLRRI
jgi:hypothetical protein